MEVSSRCIGTVVPRFTAYNVKSRIAACSIHLKNFHGFVAKASCNSYSSVTVDSVCICAIFTQGTRVEVTRTKLFVVNGIPYFLYGTYI